MTALPHFAWPLRFATRPDGTVGFALVEQDTTSEHNASAALIASVPRGAREDDPTFGVSPLIFDSSPLDTDRLAAEIQQSDPRLDIDATEVLDLLAPTHPDIHAAVSSRA